MSTVRGNLQRVCVRTFCTGGILLASLGDAAVAQTVQSQTQLFTGTNIYASNVIYDAQTSQYKMWYGGWQTSGYTDDRIFYRTSSNGTSWSSYSTVLTVTTFQQKVLQRNGVSISAAHVNNPSVTKFINGVTGQYQYTMFFTICLNPCGTGAGVQQIWSMTSPDGVNWDYPIQLNITFTDGSSDPIAANAVASSNGPAGTVWRVQTGVLSGATNKIYLVYVDGNRVPIGNATAVLTSSGALAQNPSRIYVGGQWYMFYNRENAYSGYDVWYTTSSNDQSWSGETPLIVANNAPICAVQTPQALATGANTFNLYMGFANAVGSGCGFTAHGSIGSWGYSIP